MVEEWKKGYYAQKEREEAAKKQKQEKLNHAKYLKYKQEEQKQQQEYDRKLEAHKQKFRCYICGKPSDGPYQFIEEFASTDQDSSRVTSIHGPIRWDTPTGLSHCKKCRRLVCDSDQAGGICRKDLGF